MAMAAGAALLRSVATKMSRAPPRLPYALDNHRRLPASSGGLSLSNKFSTSSGSTPSSANLRGPQTHDNKFPSDSDNKFPSDSQWYWYRAIVAFNEALPIAAFFLFGGFVFINFRVNPALDRIEANANAQCQAWVTMREDIKKSHESTRAILLSNKESQIEATDVSEGQRITGIGTK